MVWKRWKRDGGGKECGGAEGKGEEAGEWGKEGGGGGIGRGCYQTQFGHPGRQGRGCDNLRWKETPFGN